MATKFELRGWIIEALDKLGGRGTVTDVSRQVWTDHEPDLLASGDLFFTLQYDIRWAAQALREQGHLTKPARRNSPWSLPGK